MDGQGGGQRKGPRIESTPRVYCVRPLSGRNLANLFAAALLLGAAKFARMGLFRICLPEAAALTRCLLT